MTVSSLLARLPYGAIILICSCSPGVYTPSTQQIPMLKEAGEVAASAGKIGAQNPKALEFQGSVAITEQLALMAGYYNFESTGNYLGRRGGKVRELAIGYYGYREDKTAPASFLKIWKPGFSHALFIGYGRGNGFLEIYGRYISNERYTWFNLEQFFLQGSFGINSTYFDGALSSRFTFLKYSNVGNLFPHNAYDLRKNPAHYLWEPAVTTRYGYKFY